ncbi:putative HTH-type transcriptional regulator YulB [Listeria floridensis FSL S10-1187]|uniref:HTH-type transcriptional regulator YulB n=1 Tax=Listeria floridensis FSL S10-1187 TaxID=1265817 RepID=A0ABN0RFN9_9LIST|nr:DeoR/GlpR family DNA-binding transcription regulator [Listeria floridensis]EUJ32397.1 putative HTH-type transcriptional regulator YulB [Listeria floridensis FSL S10-1187]
MLSIERKRAIVQYVRSRKIATVSELAQHFSVHEATIRRDLTALEQDKKLKRTHGGVMIEEKVVSEPDWNKRSEVRYEEKKRIATYAAEMVEDGDTILLDAGTTTGYIAEVLKDRPGLTIITNDLRAASILRFSKSKIIVTGGVIYPDTYILNGMIADETIQNIHVHKAFVTTPALDIDKGLMHYDEYLVPVKKEILHSADEVILVTDHTKFGRLSLYKYADVDKISCIVTGEELDSLLKEQFEEKGVQIYLT